MPLPLFTQASIGAHPPTSWSLEIMTATEKWTMPYGGRAQGCGTWCPARRLGPTLKLTGAYRQTNPFQAITTSMARRISLFGDQATECGTFCQADRREPILQPNGVRAVMCRFRRSKGSDGLFRKPSQLQAGLAINVNAHIKQSIKLLK